MDVAYGYDALNRVVSETSGGITHQYVFDLAGNRLQTVYGGTGRTLNSIYDALNRLQKITESPDLNGGRVTQYGYDAAGNQAWKILPNGDSVTTVYDGLNREVTITGYSVTGNELYLYANGRNLAGNVVAIGEETANLPVRILAMSDDGVNRLASEQVTMNGQTETTAYIYDAANNRATRTKTVAAGVNMSAYSYDGDNRLTAYTEGANTETFGYDANGSRISWSKNGAQTATYGYDPEQRLISLLQDGHVYGYTYDYRTRRVGRTEDGTSTQVIFSGGTSVQEIENSATSVEYVRGSDWLSRDPIGENGGLNLYAYVGNEPVGLTDPLGLAAPPAIRGANPGGTQYFSWNTVPGSDGGGDYWDRYLNYVNQYDVNPGPYAAALLGGVWPKGLSPATSCRGPLLGSSNPLTSVPRGFGFGGDWAGTAAFRAVSGGIGVATVGAGFWNIGIYIGGLGAAAGWY